jgi:hypothetical protein
MMGEVTMSHSKAQASKSTQFRFAAAVIGLVVLLGMAVTLVRSGEGTEFPGTVLTVDQVAGKFAVKKDGGGTRFTFVANEKTKFAGTGLVSLRDLKKDDHVLVVYRVQGSQYLADSVTKK